MPRISQKRRDENLAELVCARWRQSERQRRDREPVWDRSYNDHDPNWIDPEVDTSPKVKFPYLHRVTSIQTTSVLEATDANSRWLVAQPTTPAEDNTDRAEAVTEFLEFQYRQKSPSLFDNNSEALERCLQMGLKYGNSYAMVEWERRDDWWGCRIKSLDPYDVWLDADHGRFYLLRRTVSLAQLFDIAQGISAPTREILRDPETGNPQINPDTGRAIEIEVPPRDGGRALRVVRKIEKSIKSGETPGFLNPEYARGTDRRHDFGRVSGDGARSGRHEEEVRVEDDPFNALIDIIEMYETHGSGLVAKVIPFHGSATPGLVMQAEKNPWGACPIIPFLPYRVDNEFYGLGNGEIVGLLAKAMDYNLRGSLGVIAATAWPPLLHKRSANLRRQYFKSIYGMAFEVRDTGDMAFMQTNISPAFHQVGQQIAQAAADFGTGESDIRRGNVGAARSATAAAIGEAFANLTDRFVFRHWRGFMEQVGHVCISIARVHITATEAVPILGRRSVDFIDLKPEFFRGTWAVTFGGNARGANPTQMFAEHAQMASIYGASGVIDMRESAREGYRLIGDRNPERFLLQKDDRKAIKAEDEHLALLEFNTMPEVSPQENLIEHFQKHGATLQEWAQTLGPADPRVEKLTLHFQATQFALQQLVAQQQGGVQGGVQPFLPSQAGQPGQPATFQPGVADLNRVRQGSNQGSPGAAPGNGAAPGRQVGGVVGGAR